VTSAQAPLLLDTAIIVLLSRGGEMAERLDSRFGLSTRREVPMVSVVSVGELLAFARNASWGARKEARLHEILANLVVVDINREPVLNAYADLSAHLKSAGRPIGQNDLWIAACARATGAVLLTTDTDFDLLHPDWIRREWVDQATLR